MTLTTHITIKKYEQNTQNKYQNYTNISDKFIKHH